MFSRYGILLASQASRICRRAARQARPRQFSNSAFKSGAEAGQKQSGKRPLTHKQGLIFAIACGVSATGLTIMALPFQPHPKAEAAVVSTAREEDQGTPEEVTKKSREATADEAPVAMAEEPDRHELHYKYVIVGTGTCAYGTIKGIRERDPTTPILVIGEELLPPYQRPPLSKELWFDDHPDVPRNLSFVNWQGHKGSIVYESRAVLEEARVQLLLGNRVQALDPNEKTLLLSDGTTIKFDNVLLAVGGKPRVPSSFAKPELRDSVSTYRTSSDFQKLVEIAKTKQRMVVVGGGFLGTELAIALHHHAQKHGAKVVQVFPESGVLHRVLPTYLSEYTTRKVAAAGIDVRPNVRVDGAHRAKDGSVALHMSSASESGVAGRPPQTLAADHVVVCVGIAPCVELAEKAGLEVDSTNGGIAVNQNLAARHAIYAAGDVCSYYDSVLGRRRIEHYDHAFESGKVAGLNMAGLPKAYDYQSMFWSSLEGLNISFEAVGRVDHSLKTVSFWEGGQDAVAGGKEPVFKRGVVYYLAPLTNRPVGVLLWNTYGKGLDEARALIHSQKEFSESDLRTLQYVVPLNAPTHARL